MSKLNDAIKEKIKLLVNKDSIQSNLTAHRIEHDHAKRYLRYLIATIDDNDALENALVRFFKIRPAEFNTIGSSVTDVHDLLKERGILSVLKRSAEETLITKFLIALFAAPNVSSLSAEETFITQFLIAQFAAPIVSSLSASVLVYKIMANVEPAGIRALNKYTPTFDWEEAEFLVGLTTRRCAACRDLHWAVRNNNSDMVKLLFAAGVDVNKVDSSDFCALDIAIAERHDDMVFQLLCHPNIHIKKAHEPRLIQFFVEAIKTGVNDKITPILSIKNLSKSEFINKKLPDGETLLTLAALRCRKPMIEILLQNGASVGNKNAKGNTALSILAGRRKEFQLPEHAAIVELLLKKMPSSHVNATAEDGKTALAWAVEADNHPIVLLLVKFEGIDLDGKFDGKTIGQIAIDKNWVSVANALREKGVALSSDTEEVKALKKEQDALLVTVALQAKEIAMLKNENASKAVNSVVSFVNGTSSTDKSEPYQFKNHL